MNQSNVEPSFDCKERLVKDIAIVEIYFGTQFATRLSKDITATFTDKLASIGECLDTIKTTHQINDTFY